MGVDGQDTDMDSSLEVPYQAANLTGEDVAGVKAWRITEHEVEELRLAHKVANGWIVWSEEKRDLIFLPAEEWLERLAARSAPSQ